MVVVLEQDLELVVTVAMSEFPPDLFDGRGHKGRVALLKVMWRDVLPIGACNELGPEGGFSDL